MAAPSSPTPSSREAALRLLAAREHSQRELSRKLAQRGYEPDDIAAALQALVVDGYLSDERYAAAKTRSLIGRGKGPIAIQAVLRQAGVASAPDHDEDWFARARAVLVRKFPDAPADQRELAKRARFLAARGYPASVIGRVLRTVEGGDFD